MKNKCIYQERYLEHQSRKIESLKGKKEETSFEKNTNFEVKQKLENFLELITNRRSQRQFNMIPISNSELFYIRKAIQLTPSSCNRQAIYIIDTDKDFAESMLVGGKGWINKANKIFLVFADRKAYKSPSEKLFMPYLDAGFVSQNVYLMCETLNIGCCFVNPNMINENIEIFENKYGDDIFCGALVIGNYNEKANTPPIRDIKEVQRL